MTVEQPEVAMQVLKERAVERQVFLRYNNINVVQRVSIKFLILFVLFVLVSFDGGQS